jgi:hypothetical protein
MIHDSRDSRDAGTAIPNTLAPLRRAAGEPQSGALMPARRPRVQCRRGERREG